MIQKKVFKLVLLYSIPIVVVTFLVSRYLRQRFIDSDVNPKPSMHVKKNSKKITNIKVKTDAQSNENFEINFCSKCGKKLDSSDLFCPKCGNKIK